jgi:leader peptidase (prepilin peptidase)/N-methyltransferase
VSEREVLLYIFSFILGSVIGSFLNVCIYRLPRGESIVFPPSHCTSCGSGIKFYNNIPVLSFLILGGKCADCGTRISLRYPAVELLSGLVMAGLFYKFGLSLDTLFYALLVYSLVAVTFIDLSHMIIPNVITIPGMIIGLLFNILSTNWQIIFEQLIKSFKLLTQDQQGLIIDWQKLWELFGLSNLNLEVFFQVIDEVPFLGSVFGLIIGGGLLFLIAFLYIAVRKQEGMGMGDVKLLAMIGAFLGWKGVVFVMLVSSLLGTVTGLSIILYKKGNLKYALPFGPFLSLAAVIYVFTGGFRLIN